MLAESAEIHDTCIRPRRCVCGSMFNMWSHAHTCIHVSAMQQQSSSQRVGALFIHRPAWVDQHTGGSRLTPTIHRCPKGMVVGGPCDQTAQYTVQKHTKDFFFKLFLFFFFFSFFFFLFVFPFFLLFCFFFLLSFDFFSFFFCRFFSVFALFLFFVFFRFLFSSLSLVIG